MSDLGELFEALHDAGRFRTARVVFRIWSDDALRNAAFIAGAEARGATFAAVGRDDDEPGESESEVRLWLELPDRARLERDDSHISVKDGESWWSWSREWGATTNVGSDTKASHNVGDEYLSLLNPWTLAGALDWTAEGRDGSVLLARARPRERLADRDEMLTFGLHAFGSGADEYVFAIDAASGVVKRVEALFGVKPFQVIVTTELELDADLPPETFVFEAPDGAVAEPWEGRFTRYELSIGEIAERAGFTVLVPERVPEGWRLDSHYLPQSKRPLMSESVSLFYRSDDGTASVSLGESVVGDRAGAGAFLDGKHWQDMERDGRSFRFRGRSEEWRQPQLYIELEGTAVLMSSDTLSNEDLIALALRLRPASGGSALGDS